MSLSVWLCPHPSAFIAIWNRKMSLWDVCVCFVHVPDLIYTFLLSLKAILFILHGTIQQTLYMEITDCYSHGYWHLNFTHEKMPIANLTVFLRGTDNATVWTCSRGMSRECYGDSIVRLILLSPPYSWTVAKHCEASMWMNSHTEWS